MSTDRQEAQAALEHWERVRGERLPGGLDRALRVIANRVDWERVKRCERDHPGARAPFKY